MSKTYDVTLVTYEAFPNLTPDDQLLRMALEERGVRVRAAIWSDRSVDWSASAVTVLRSMWDYFHRIKEFEEWLGFVETHTKVRNSADVARWNMHKGYLRDLAQRGVPVIPTSFLRRGEPANIERICKNRGWHDIVIKPCIAGSAYHAKRFVDEVIYSEGAEHINMLLGIQDVMVQPYVPAVETSRERALVFIGGIFSHAGLKAPFSAGPAAGEPAAVKYNSTPEEIAFAARVVSALDDIPDYARVDFVMAEHGPVVMELELIEPALYFAFDHRAAGRLADILITQGASGTNTPKTSSTTLRPRLSEAQPSKTAC